MNPDGELRRLVVGTAGHVDHGKTRLVEALTGIDCDRWAEEKQRGITIDLGFAHFTEGDLQVGFVDVPGHERFLHNALAGLGGIRILMLVVAADEGVKPQTREHLAICSLLGIPGALVVLTKADLVDPELIELAQLEIEELLAETPFAGAPVLPVSSKTGDGIGELRARLVELADRYPTQNDPNRPFRLPVDRAFHLKGLGLVVTGTSVSGSVAGGDELTLLPTGQTVRVRDLQVHGQERERAEAGERTSLRLSGVELAEIERGMQLTTPDAFAAGRDLCVHFQLLADAPAAIEAATPIRLHLFSGEVVGRLRPLGDEPIEPGETGLAEIRLSAPVVAVRGDRFVVRRPSPPLTLGGGVVLDPAWSRPRGKAGRALARLLAGDCAEAATAWVQDGGEGGIDEAEIARRLGEPEATVRPLLEGLQKDGKALVVPATASRPAAWLAPAAFQRITRRAEKELKSLFARDRLSRGMPKAEAVERVFPGRAARLADVFLEWLTAAGTLEIADGRVTLPGRSAKLTQAESTLATALVETFEAAGLTPPSPAELARELSAKPQILDGVVRYLTDRGRLVRLPEGLILAGKAVRDLEERLRATGWERFSVPQFKDEFGLSRKWAIPLLEHLDSIGVTRRLGNERMIAARKDPSS